jgi:hypothetical protein
MSIRRRHARAVAVGGAVSVGPPSWLLESEPESRLVRTNLLCLGLGRPLILPGGGGAASPPPWEVRAAQQLSYSPRQPEQGEGSVLKSS